MKRISMLTAMCVQLCIISCKQTEEKEEPARFLATSPIRMDTSTTKEYVCQINGIRHIELRSQETGYLKNIYVDEGQYVHKGQLLFRIMPNLYKADYQKANAEAKASSIEVQNTEKLSQKNIVSANELALAKAKLNAASAEVALAKTHLGFTEIRAPFDGIVGKLETKLGSLINEDDLLTTLSDNSKMWVYFNVPEKEYLDYKQSASDASTMTVQLRMANDQIYPYSGIVKTIEADFDNETGNIAFRATFPNPKQLLRNGETGNILMTVPLNRALLVPQKATFDILEKTYVFVIDKNNQVHQREIGILSTLPDLYVVKDGLQEGDKILLEGLRRVTDGEKIQPNYQDPKYVLAHLSLPAE